MRLRASVLAGALTACASPTPQASHHAPSAAVVIVGDTGKVTQERDQVAAAIQRWCRQYPCDAVLIPGDLLYPSGMESPDDPRFDAMLAPFEVEGASLVLAMGNHDWQRTHQARAERWMRSARPRELPGADYSTTLGPLHIDVVDSDTVFWQHSRHATAVLEQPRRAPLRLLLTHHPFLSAGPHGDAGQYEGLPLPIVGGRALRDLYQAQVCGRYDWVFTGHDHSLQHLQRCDVDFVVSGSGASTTSVDPSHPSLKFGASTPGFAYLQAHADGSSTLQLVDAQTQVLHLHVRSAR